MSAALLGASFGLALGAIFLVGGLNQAVADHFRATRIARQAGGALSETILQREIKASLDPAALTLARAHDSFAMIPRPIPPPGSRPGLAWPVSARPAFPIGRHASALDNARDLDCLTEAVYFEARGETPPAARPPSPRSC